MSRKIIPQKSAVRDPTEVFPPPSPLPISSAALAGLDDHVGELLDFRGATHVVEDGEGLQVLRDAAGRGGRFGV